MPLTGIGVGQSADLERTFTQQDFDRFAALSGDDNPIHVDPEFSARTRFGRTVAHGMLLYGAIFSAVGSLLPGPGTAQLEQELIFPSPTYAREQLTVHLEITALPGDKFALLMAVLRRPDGEVGCEGKTLVQLPDHPSLSHFHPRVPPARGGESLTPGVRTHRGLSLGQSASVRRAFSLADLRAYADLTGDANPLYTDAGYARQRGLRGPLLPGPLLGGMFSYLLGTQLPGRGTNWLRQRFSFTAPAFPEEEITARVEVVRLRPEKDLADLSTVCTIQDGQVVCQGEALVLVKDLEIH